MRSVPSEPAVDLTPIPATAPSVVISDLADLFPAQVGVPTPLSGLTPGLPGAEARALLDAAHRPGIRMMAQALQGHLVIQTELADVEGVGIALILDGEGTALQEVDVSLPASEASAVLGSRWGDPELTSSDDEGHPVYRWNGTPWTAELRAAGDKAVLKYQAR